MKREKFCKESLFPASGTRIESFVSWQTYFPFSLSPTLTKILFSPEKSVQTSDSCKFSHYCCNPRNSRATSERERFSKSFQYLSNYYSKRIIYPIISIVSRRCVSHEEEILQVFRSLLHAFTDFSRRSVISLPSLHQYHGLFIHLCSRIERIFAQRYAHIAF